MRTAVVAIGLLTTVTALTPHAQAPAQSGTFLVIVDELNLEFRTTPQLRELTGRVLRALVGDMARGAIVSTGTSAVFVPPTSDAASLEAANRRLVGSGLKPREFLAAGQPPEFGLEVRHRAAVALESAAEAITRVAAGQNGGPLTVIYISNGDAAGDLPERMALIETAVRVGASVHAIDPRGLADPAQNQGISQADWDAYVKATRGSLVALTEPTQGTVAVSAADVASLLSRLAKASL